MTKLAWTVIGLTAAAIIAGVGLEITERVVFPVWKPNYYEKSPAMTGPYTVTKKKVGLDLVIEGKKYGVTVYTPVEATGELPLFIWMTGSNIQAYYHQSLHETMSSWGYQVLVPDTPPFSFTDLDYHRVILEIASKALSSALNGDYGAEINDGKIAAGGFSLGSSLAAFLGGQRKEISALVFWGPSGSPYWLGVDGKDLYLRVNQPALYVLGELDESAPVSGGYPDRMKELMPDSETTTVVIENGNHQNFQQPTGSDKFAEPSKISRYEQLGIAIDETRKWLNSQLGVG